MRERIQENEKKDGSYLLIRTEWQLQKNRSGEYNCSLKKDGLLFIHPIHELSILDFTWTS